MKEKSKLKGDIKKEAKTQAMDIVQTIRNPLVVLDSNLNVTFANSSFYQTFNVDIKKTIGKKVYPFTVTGENLFELVMESNKLSFPDVVEKCDLCNSDNLVLSARISGTKKFKYVEIKCLHCKGSLVFGNMMESPNTYYIRKNAEKHYDWKAYTPDTPISE